MPRRTRDPSLIEDLGALAGLYGGVIRLMAERLRGRSQPVMFEPSEEPPPYRTPAPPTVLPLRGRRQLAHR